MAASVPVIIPICDSIYEWPLMFIQSLSAILPPFDFRSSTLIKLKHRLTTCSIERIWNLYHDYLATHSTTQKDRSCLWYTGADISNGGVTMAVAAEEEAKQASNWNMVSRLSFDKSNSKWIMVKSSSLVVMDTSSKSSQLTLLHNHTWQELSANELMLCFLPMGVIRCTNIRNAGCSSS